MHVRPFILTHEHQEELKKLAKLAEDHPYSSGDMLDLANSNGRIGDPRTVVVPAGDIIHNKCFIPVGYCIVYSVEEQPQGMTRHLSVSVDEDERIPSIPVVEVVMQILGFKTTIKNCLVRIDDIKPIHPGGHRGAINVWELIK